MKNINITLGAVIISTLIGCSTAPQVLDRVGPVPTKIGGSSSIGEGWLVVRTATDTYEIGDNTYYHPHTGYSIYTDSGTLWNYIPNHNGNMDESATRVRIPAGRYNIHAQSDFGPVIVPVLIGLGKTTEANLDTSGVKGSRNTNDTTVVWLPKGRSRAYYEVGWKAEEGVETK